MEMFVMNIIEQQSESLLVTDQGLGWGTGGLGGFPLLCVTRVPVCSILLNIGLDAK